MRKDTRVQFVIEDELADAFERLAGKLGKSKSGYMRELIIIELQARGLMTEPMLTKLLASA